MIDLMAPPPPMPRPLELDSFNALAQLLADPAATAKRLEMFRADVEANRSAAEKGLRDLHAVLNDGLSRRDADLEQRLRDHEAERDTWARTTADKEAALERDRADVDRKRGLIEAFVRDNAPNDIERGANEWLGVQTGAAAWG